MKKSKSQKAITLIALIITIIILLILAVVTIGSIKDSSIIDYSKDAASEHTIAQEKEWINLALSEWQIQKVLKEKSFEEVITTSLADVATVKSNPDGTLTVTMNKTGNPYTLTDSGEILPAEKGISISPTGIVINEGETKKITVTLLGGLSGDVTYSSSDENIATVSSKGEVTGVSLGSATITVTCGEYSATCIVAVSNIEQYFFGDDDQVVGRPLAEIAEITSTGMVLKNDTTPIFKGNVADINILKIIQIGDWGYTYFKYKGVYYKSRANRNQEDIEIDGVLPGYTDENYGMKIIDMQGERIGKTVSFDGKLWTIIYDDNTNGLQMVCNEVLKYTNGTYEFTLGKYDDLIPVTEDNMSNWDKVKDKADLDKDGTLTNFERAVYSYNHAIETLNTACDNLVSENSNILDVRCVGSNPINKNAENTTAYLSTKLENWPISDSNHSAGIAKGIGKGSDTNYESDYDRMVVLGIDNEKYWLASRMVIETADYVQFHILRVYYNRIDIETRHNEGPTFLWYITESTAYGTSNSDYLRPVVVLKSDANLVPDTTGSANYILQ